MEKTYEVTTFNTITRKYEKVSVSKEVYHAYTRTGWNTIGIQIRRHIEGQRAICRLAGNADLFVLAECHGQDLCYGYRKTGICICVCRMLWILCWQAGQRTG